MLQMRNKALKDLRKKHPVINQEFVDKKVPEVFGEHVFGNQELRDKLHPDSYIAFRNALENGASLDPAIADEIATIMKEWAIRKGATHFTHWFQPLTGCTAEKHDSFIGFSGGAYNRKLNVHFSGKQLIKGESDASSFPNGGIRSTFEARGYTAWDMESPSFIREGANGKYLCIPTAFASWTGESLDLKTPLLRSNEAVGRATARLCQLLGYKNVTGGYSNVGIEQEFFMIDRGFYMSRPDLLATGRTLVGTAPSKGQELEDHYFAAFDRRVLAFIQDAEWRLWRLGVPSTTRHYEVAPSQYEMAPIFETISVACDHNMLMMEVLKETARDHDLACLFHEKPFAGVNGSGKHNNWSICTNTGENLMEPGDNPEKNTQFLVVLAALVRAVRVHGDLMRAAIAVPGNDFRLGANEAPPAVMSVYVGDLLASVVNDIIKIDNIEHEERETELLLGTNCIPPLPKDFSDRNRTSPFAFTGNKFEFRAVGSSQSCARPGLILNTILAESMHFVADEIEKELSTGIKLELAISNVITRVLKENQAAIFNGNGYSSEWVEEAERKGLANLRTCPEAIKEFGSEKNIKIFEDMKVLSRREVESQQTTLYENFSKTIAIESDCLLQMTTAYILPAVLEYKTKLTSTLDVKQTPQAKLYHKYDSLINELLVNVDGLEHLRHKAEEMKSDLHEEATFYREKVMVQMDLLRKTVDTLERLVDDKIWPFPKYSEMLFMK